MTDVNIKTHTPRDRQLSARKQAQLDRLKRVAAGRRRPGIRVVPANEDLRRVLKHPNGMGFRPEGSVEWPDDKFTRKRIAEGSVTVEEKHDEHKHDEHKHEERHRGQRPKGHEDTNSAA
jgi:hypothetical protein